jgi:Uma2 family endonuclease
MDLDNMPQPDAFMVILPSHGGKARVDADDYLVGSPELIVEVAASSASYDLHDKLVVYRRNGVREYIVWRTFDNAMDYFILRGSEYVRHVHDEHGKFKSEVFPGLWLDATNLLNGDLAAVLKHVQEGIASPEHAEFVARLKAAEQPK